MPKEKSTDNPVLVLKVQPLNNPAFEGDEDTEKSHTAVDLKEEEEVKEKDPEKKDEEAGKEEEEEEEEEEEDPWSVDSLKQNYIPWSELSKRDKWKRVIVYSIKFVLIFAFLYLFICSLDFLSSAFQLLGGKKAGEVFRQSDILSNPVAGLMMGVLVTVLVQSSSTSTSIIISMVAEEILTVRTAVPIIMGANIGTSVTNTIVSFGQITNKDEFRRAFAGATVHDMFNLMSVCVLLPLEMITGYLFHLSGAIVDSMHLNETQDLNKDLLKTITKPFTTLIVQVSKSDIKKIATKSKTAEEATLLKFCCDKGDKPETCCGKKLTSLGDSVYKEVIGATYSSAKREAVCQAVDECVRKSYAAGDSKLTECATIPWGQSTIVTTHNVNTLNCSTLQGTDTEMKCCKDTLKAASFYMNYGNDATATQQTSLCTDINMNCYTGKDVQSTCLNSWVTGRTEEGQGEVFSCADWTKKVETNCLKDCEYLFRSAHESQGGSLSDEGIGAIMLVLSLILLCVCLICLVHLLQTLLKGPIAKLIKKFVNANFPGYCGYFTGYLAILIGAGLTILVQSSSIFTSTFTPLVGLGVIHLDRMYPLTLGSNIGTTATGVLAALAQKGHSIPRSLQVAFCHLFFNISGILIFYPFPFFRPPINAAKFLGNTTAEYRWFAVVYLIAVFFVIPVCVFGLSIPGWYVLVSVLVPILLVAIVVGIIKCIQAKKPTCLPPKLRNWGFLPLPLRSLKPYDRVMRKLLFCKRFQNTSSTDKE